MYKRPYNNRKNAQKDFENIVIVERINPTDRYQLAGDNRLTGILRIKCEVRREPPSFLHIGRGMPRLKVREEPQRVCLLTEFKNLVKTASRVISMDYADIVSYGGKYCIPGTTLKGLCRARLELSIVARGDTVSACFRQASPPRAALSRRQQGWRHYIIWEPTTRENRGVGCNPTRGDGVCVVCNLFGAPGLASRVDFGNLYAVGEVSAVELTLDHNEKIEAIPPGTVFEGSICFRFLEPYELGLLLVGLGADRDGSFREVLIGKSKYRVRCVLDASDRRLRGREVEFGVVRFSLVELRLWGAELKGFEGSSEGDFVVYRGEELTGIAGILVQEAEKRVPGLRVGISEYEKVLELRTSGGSHGGTR